MHATLTRNQRASSFTPACSLCAHSSPPPACSRHSYSSLRRALLFGLALLTTPLATFAADNQAGHGAAAQEPGLPSIRLAPLIRRIPLANAIPAPFAELIKTHLTENRILSAADFAAAPAVLGARAGRSITSQGDTLFARGAWTAGTPGYDIFRHGRELIGQDSANVEAIFVGTAALIDSNDQDAMLVVGRTVQEVRTGDRLLPRRNPAVDAWRVPAPPPFAVDAGIVGIGAAKTLGGLYDTLIVNIGSRDGIAAGHLLSVQEPGTGPAAGPARPNRLQRANRALNKATHRTLNISTQHAATFAGAPLGSVLIYRVFDDASLALVLTSRAPIRLDARVVAP